MVSLASGFRGRSTRRPLCSAAMSGLSDAELADVRAQFDEVRGGVSRAWSIGMFPKCRVFFSDSSTLTRMVTLLSRRSAR